MHDKLNSQILTATLSDIDKLTQTMLVLRPHLTPKRFKTMLPVLFNEGYQIIYIGDDKLAFALAGFRTLNFLFSGKTLYLDDLVTHPQHIRNGYAGLLIDWLKEFAIKNNYDHLSLDSGFQRKDAYRLYLNKGLEVESLHFGRKVSDLKLQ